MRALIIGYGSIGSRHARLLKGLGCEVAVVTQQDVVEFPVFRAIDLACVQFHPDYVVVANETAMHQPALETLARCFGGKLLVEKPLGLSSPDLLSAFSSVAVGYNLRFHPLLHACREAIKGQKIISMDAYCGQYLPTWRVGRDYRECYSSDAVRGGGVLEDLSHELDYLMWLGGSWISVVASGGRFSNLEISSDDSWAALISLQDVPLVTLRLNYLDKPARRHLIIQTRDHSYAIDFVRGEFVADGVSQQLSVERDYTYIEQHKAILEGNYQSLCNAAEGLQVMSLITAMQASRSNQGWVSR